MVVITVLIYDELFLGSLEIVGLLGSLFLVAGLISMGEIKNHRAKQSQRMRALPCLVQS